LIKNLEKNSKLLITLYRKFAQVYQYIQLMSIREAEKTATVQVNLLLILFNILIEFKIENGVYKRCGPMLMMVEEASAFLSWNNEITYMIEADHTKMVKFEHPNDRHYITIEEYIKSLIKISIEKISERFAKSSIGNYILFSYKCANQ
jgi:hypothetical protein